MRMRAEFLEDEIKKRDVAHWVKVFNEVGLAGHRIDSLEDIREMFCTRRVTMIWTHGTMGALFLLFVLRITRLAVLWISHRPLMCV